jgi:drug/metabolite transporter (DMT)-like permease
MVAVIFLFGIILGACGGIFMKLGANHIGHVEIHSLLQLFEYLVKLFTNFASLAGIALYFLSAVIWSYLLTKLDISLVQPILALTYVVTPILAIIFLKEHVAPMRWLGILIIVIGVFVVARSATA